MSSAFEIEDLVKSFGKVNALSGISLSSNEGTIFGLLGPNGAGKTTIIRILSTLLTPTSGTAKVLGIDVIQAPEKVRRVIGLAGQYAALDEFQTGYENVFMTARLYGLSHVEAKKRTLALLERLELTEAANRTVRTYSGGMRRRLDLGASLVGEPKILFLDEPTTGLDPRSRLAIWNLVRELVKEGTSILLTTQYLEEADELADQIVVINEGKLIAQGTSNELKAQHGGDIIEFRLTNANDQPAAFRIISQFAKAPPTFNSATLQVHVPIQDGSEKLVDIVSALKSAHILITALSLHQPSLDDVFCHLPVIRPEIKLRKEPLTCYAILASLL